MRRLPAADDLAQALGADLAYLGTRFIATKEANATDANKQCIIDSTGEEIVYTNLFTGVHGNYMKRSIAAAGLDPDDLPTLREGFKRAREVAHQKPMDDFRAREQSPGPDVKTDEQIDACLRHDAAHDFASVLEGMCLHRQHGVNSSSMLACRLVSPCMCV